MTSFADREWHRLQLCSCSASAPRAEGQFRVLLRGTGVVESECSAERRSCHQYPHHTHTRTFLVCTLRGVAMTLSLCSPLLGVVSVELRKLPLAWNLQRGQLRFCVHGIATTLKNCTTTSDAALGWLSWNSNGS